MERLPWKISDFFEVKSCPKSIKLLASEEENTFELRFNYTVQGLIKFLTYEDFYEVSIHVKKMPENNF